MRSFVGFLHDDESPDERLLRHLGGVIRLPASSAPVLEVDDRCALAVVSHRADRSGTLILRESSLTAAGSIRLDDRESLSRHLDVEARNANDLELVMRAWKRWGTECVAHLFGDYSFVIRDRASGELFGARDRFGVRPFYYARTHRTLVFSDVLEAVIAHPDVDIDELDNAAVADYLSVGVCEDAEATIFAQVRRLAPAHVLTHRGGGRLELRRYWTLRATEPETDSGDIPGRLEVALKNAVQDRVDDPTAIVFMSGGLDSPALAALTREVRPETRLLAATSVYRSRIPDVEEAYAVEAARSVGIPIRCFPLDAYSPLQSLDEGFWTADPGPLHMASMTRDIYSVTAEHAPVAIHGHPADAVLYADLTSYLRRFLQRRDLMKLAAALVRYVAVKRRPPYFFFRDLLGWPRRRTTPAGTPDWFAEDLAPRLAAARPTSSIGALNSPIWSSYFEWAHPLLTGAPIELVYPWCDVRVVEAALAMPAIPWLVDKHALRAILRGRISETIRQRKKAFVQGDPWTAALPVGRDIEIQAASRYIDPMRFRDACRAAGSLSDTTLRAVVFEYWIRELPVRVAKLRSDAEHTSYRPPDRHALMFQ